MDRVKFVYQIIWIDSQNEKIRALISNHFIESRENFWYFANLFIHVLHVNTVRFKTDGFLWTVLNKPESAAARIKSHSCIFIETKFVSEREVKCKTRGKETTRTNETGVKIPSIAFQNCLKYLFVSLQCGDSSALLLCARRQTNKWQTQPSTLFYIIGFRTHCPQIETKWIHCCMGITQFVISICDKWKNKSEIRCARHSFCLHWRRSDRMATVSATMLSERLIVAYANT